MEPGDEKNPSLAERVYMISAKRNKKELTAPAVPNHSPIQEMRQEKREEKRKGGVFGRATAAQGRLSSASIRCR